MSMPRIPDILIQVIYSQREGSESGYESKQAQVGALIPCGQQLLSAGI